jgi:hypothetical protein
MTSTKPNEQQATVDFLSRGEAYGLPDSGSSGSRRTPPPSS